MIKIIKVFNFKYLFILIVFIVFSIFLPNWAFAENDRSVCIEINDQEYCLPLTISENSFCLRTAEHLLNICQLRAVENYYKKEITCQEEANCEDEFDSEFETCLNQYKAHVFTCQLLQENSYNPEILAENFSINIDNPYYPLSPGKVYIYRVIDEEGRVCQDRVEVLRETTTIGGVTVRIVKDTVSCEGEVQEETYDFYAQDQEGNVWYFGEDSREFENGWIKSIKGTWYTGVEGAKPGIIMKAHPQPGEVYRQEYHPGNAEDLAGVLSLNETVAVPYGTFSHCLKTVDWSPLEPEILEYKYYAPGIGFVKSISSTGETVELIAIEEH